MKTALLCVALLGLLLFGLGLAISLVRQRTGAISGYKDDPADLLYKLVRAHGNTAEYAPMVALLILYVGARDPSAWKSWAMIGTTICRFMLVAGLLMWPSMDRANPLRFVGALGTYIGGAALSVALLF